MVTCLRSGYGGVFANFKRDTAIIIGVIPQNILVTRVYYALGYSAIGQPTNVRLPKYAAQAIDTKIDDGVDKSGNVGVLFKCTGFSAAIGVPVTWNYPNYTDSCNVSLAKKILK